MKKRIFSLVTLLALCLGLLPITALADASPVSVEWVGHALSNGAVTVTARIHDPWEGDEDSTPIGQIIDEWQPCLVAYFFQESDGYLELGDEVARVPFVTDTAALTLDKAGDYYLEVNASGWSATPYGVPEAWYPSPYLLDPTDWEEFSGWTGPGWDEEDEALVRDIVTALAAACREQGVEDLEELARRMEEDEELYWLVAEHLLPLIEKYGWEALDLLRMPEEADWAVPAMELLLSYYDVDTGALSAPKAAPRTLEDFEAEYAQRYGESYARQMRLGAEKALELLPGLLAQLGCDEQTIWDALWSSASGGSAVYQTLDDFFYGIYKDYNEDAVTILSRVAEEPYDSLADLFYLNGKMYPETHTAFSSTQPVQVDGATRELQAYALKDPLGNLTNYVKVRDVAALLDGTAAQFNVGWDGSVNLESGKAYTSRNGQENQTPYSNDRVYDYPEAATNVNGVEWYFEAFVLTDDNGNGSTYYKLRDLGEALGFNVGWSAQRGIFIETDRPYDPAN